jgi:hypothetical protein
MRRVAFPELFLGRNERRNWAGLFFLRSGSGGGHGATRNQRLSGKLFNFISVTHGWQRGQGKSAWLEEEELGGLT